MTSNAISFENVSYQYRHNWTGKRISALNSLTLDVKAGEFFGFLGHNGAGKTTTMKCLLSLIKPSTGSIKLFGVDNSCANSRSQVGYVPEQPYFYDHLTVVEIVKLYATLSGIPKDSLNACTTKALDTVRLSSRIKSPMRSLSKGLTQRVALAQAIVANPKLLVLDEPFSGLDPIGRRDFREIFSELNKTGTTIFISSHVLGDVEALCSRVSIVAHGTLQGVFDLSTTRDTGIYELVVSGGTALTGEFSSVKENTEGGRRVWHSSDKPTAEKLLHWAMQSGFEIYSYQRVRQKLEDIFLELVTFKDGERGE